MTQENKIQKLVEVDLDFHTTTHSLGSGEWSIEVQSGNEFLFELVGSNGQCFEEEAKDLWAELDSLIAEAEAIREKYIINS